MNNTFGKQYEFLLDGVGNATKNTFEKTVGNTVLSKELTSRRLQLLKLREDAITNWVKYADVNLKHATDDYVHLPTTNALPLNNKI